MRSVDFHNESNISATTAAFELVGGLYSMSVVGSNFGTVALQMVGPDPSATLLDIKETFDKADGTGTSGVDLVIGSFAASGVKKMYLPPGSYKIAVASATAVYVSIARVPGD